MSAALTTRLATPADVATMADVCSRSIRLAYTHLAAPGFLDRLIAHRFSHGRIAAQLAPFGTWLGYVVACDANGDVVGVACTGLTPEDTRAAELYVLYVAPEHQGRGAGRALVGDACRRASRRGAAQLDVAVWPGNDGALGFYQACGFVRVGERMLPPEPGLEDGPAAAVILSMSCDRRTPRVDA